MTRPIFYTDAGASGAKAGDRIRLALDRGADLALGPELADPSVSYFKAGGSSPFPIAEGMPLVSGQAYLVEFDKSAHVGGAASLALGGAAVSGLLDDVGTDRRMSVVLFAGGVSVGENGAADELCITGSAASMTIRNVSVRSLAGCHAEEASLARRPKIVLHGGGLHSVQFDLADEALHSFYPADRSGDLMTFGRSGSWLERDVGVEAGQALPVITGGDTAVTTGIAHMLGNIVGRYHASRSLSAAERQRVLTYFQQRGAAGFIPSIDVSLPGITADSTQYKVGDLE